MESIDFKGYKSNTLKRKVLREKITFHLQEISTYIYETYQNEQCDIIVITERIRLRSQGFLSENYIKAIGALIATIIDVCRLYNVPVYSVDTRAWKSAIVGTSKPLSNPYGINPEKYPTILYMKRKGLLKYIVEEYKGKGTKGVLNVKIQGQSVPCKINDDLADSYCIALYGFLPENKQKLKEETF